jgi:hypothetical protein
MPVNTPHPGYAKRLRQWKRIRDAIEGEDAVKAAGTEYVPMPRGMRKKPHLYQDYLARGSWFGATERTVLGLTGSICRRDPAVQVPKGLEPLLKDFTREGVPFPVFARGGLTEQISLGRVGFLLDRPPKILNGPIYARQYDAESMISWRTATINGVEVNTRIILEERSEEAGDDEFDTAEVCRYRVLDLDEQGLYRQRLFEEAEGKYVQTDVIEPKPSRSRLTYIPFVFVGVDSLSARIQKSPILDLVNVNYSHFRNSVSLEHGRYMTSLPQYYVIGEKLKGPLIAGAGEVWNFERPKTEVEVDILEYKGEGLGSLERADAEKREMMAALGARLLEPRKKAAETAEAKNIENAGETSILATLAGTASRGFERLLRWAAEWQGENPDEVSVKVNTDFVESRMTPEELREQVAAWQAGALPTETLGYNLKQGEVLPPDMTVEEYVAQVEAEKERKAALAPQPPPLPSPAPPPPPAAPLQ